MKYFDEINILRALAIFAVISIHISAFFTRMDGIRLLTSIYMAIDVFSHFAVPLFICISGFVLYNSYPVNPDLTEFYKKRLMTVLPPYLIFSTFYMGFAWVKSIFLGVSFDFSIPVIAYLYLTGGWNYALWFFVLIIQLYLLYPVILRIFTYCDSRNRSFELLCAAFFLGLCYNLLPVPVISLAGKQVPVIGIATMFTGYLFYFIVGMICRRNYERLLPELRSRPLFYCLWPLLLGLTILGVFRYAQQNFTFSMTRLLPGPDQFWQGVSIVTTPLYYVGIFALCLTISLPVSSMKKAGARLLEKIGQYSFGIYLVHVFILEVTVLELSWFAFDWNNWLFYPLTFSITLILSIISVEVIRKIPYNKYIIGACR
jgi:probable poly-beta-1,6-N-acetyl-D-glucosamine export protein